MTTITQSPAHLPNFDGGLSDRIAEIFAALRTAMSAAHDYDRLAGASETELSRMGLERGAIARRIFDTHFA